MQTFDSSGARLYNIRTMDNEKESVSEDKTDTAETAETEQEQNSPSPAAVADDEKDKAPKKQKRTAKQLFRDFARRYFITAFSGMALGLFCTLIIGTVIGQIGSLIGDNPFGKILY